MDAREGVIEMSASDLATRAMILRARQLGYAKRTRVMPQFARIFLVAFAAAATSCSSERPQKEAESKEIGRQLTASYYSCVRTSFASQLPTMVDRNTAMDQAFMVCQSEEAKLQAFENTLSGNPNVSSAAMSVHRNRLREELSRR
jgi:hypothetical protein